ncbi:MAG: ATP-binding protein [Planctomycetota bacterium]|nr:ATP-binding protein [Planctomycetota bacterium]
MATSNETLTADHQGELDRLRAEVKTLRHQLKHSQRLASVGTMAAMVAHEFNNILTPVVNYAQIAKSNPSLMTKALDRAASGGLRATAICQALLGFAGDQPPTPQPVVLHELVADTLSAMAREPHKDRIDLTLTIPEGTTVVTRRVELQQILLNLLLNARTAVMAQDGPRRIEVSAQPMGEALLICVSDTGVGIRPENIEKIFQPFFTTKAASPTAGEGSGLGLAICREIVRDLGGEIQVQSTLGVGTTFALQLPHRPAA